MESEKHTIPAEKPFNEIKRTEEVQSIIDRMPTHFGFVVTTFIILLVTLLFVFGWIVRYPDVVTGEIVINAKIAPVKLVANFSGKLLLIVNKSQSEVKEDDYIAVIQNSAKFEDVKKIKAILQEWKKNNGQKFDGLNKFPRNVSLGEINEMYYNFINTANLLANFRNDNVYVKQEDILNKLSLEKQKGIEAARRKLKISEENVVIVSKFIHRDSILFSRKVLTEAENDKTQMNGLVAKDAYQSVLRDISGMEGDLQDNANKRQQNKIQKTDKEKQLYLDATSALTNLEDNIKAWETKYTFKAPMNGRVQFLKFWTTNEYVQVGEPAFTIIPVKNSIIGQMTLPAHGAGKVKTGQEVIIKVEDYPYTEYGSINGKVSAISLTTNPVKVEKGAVDTYLVNIDLPNGLKTNYGSKLDFKFEIKGTGDIITNDRRLIERLFDNLKYSIKK